MACAQSLTVALLAPVLREWHRHRPEVTISLREATTMDQAFSLIDSGEVDMAVLTNSVPERFTTVGVADEEIVLTTPTDHRLARQATVRLEDLDGVPLVHFAADNGLSVWLDEALARVGVRPEPVMKTSVTAAVPQLAAAGLGVAVSPVSAVSAGIPGAVRSFSPRWFRTLVAVTPAEPDPLTARFIDDLHRHGVDVPDDVRAQLATDGPLIPR